MTTARTRSQNYILATEKEELSQVSETITIG